MNCKYGIMWKAIFLFKLILGIMKNYYENISQNSFWETNIYKYAQILISVPMFNYIFHVKGRHEGMSISGTVCQEQERVLIGFHWQERMQL